MDKQLNDSELDALRRSDAGKSHSRWKHGGVKIGMYNYAGELEREFADVYDAVENCGIDGVRYQGIVSCCEGRIRRHAGKIWKAER